jgi:hypothetical protein
MTPAKFCWEQSGLKLVPKSECEPICVCLGFGFKKVHLGFITDAFIETEPFFELICNSFYYNLERAMPETPALS